MKELSFVKKQIEVILAVGGGSAIDTAKGIAVGAACEEDILPFYMQEKVPEKMLPMGSIVTIAATGSESSNCTCLYKDNEKIEFLEDVGGHWLAQAISETYDLAHGATIALVMVPWLKSIYKKDLKRFSQYAIRVWGVEYDPNDLEGVALRGIQLTEQFLRSTGIAVKFSELDMEADIEELTKRASKRGSEGLCFTLYPEEIHKLFELIQ